MESHLKEDQYITYSSRLAEYSINQIHGMIQIYYVGSLSPVMLVIVVLHIRSNNLCIDLKSSIMVYMCMQ